MSKWSSLNGGVKVDDSRYYTLWFVILLLTVGIIIAAMRNDSNVALNVGASVESPPAVLVSSVVNEEPVAASTEEAAPATVEPKFNVAVSKYWTVLDDDEEKPYMENDGNTFSDFQRAFSLGREVPSLETSMKTYKNEDMDTYLHEEARHFVPRNDVSISDSSALANEAFQSVSRDMSPENATVILSEILSARTESSSLGINLGSVSDEQLKDLEFWSKTQGKQADLAKSILSRL